MLPLAEGPVGMNLEPLGSEQVVAVDRYSLQYVEDPTPERSSLRDQDAVRSILGHLDLGRHGVALGLDVDDAVLRQSTHPGEQQLRVAAHEHRTSRQIRVETLHPGFRSCLAVADSFQGVVQIAASSRR